MSRILLSIVIPAFNRTGPLRKTLDSVCAAAESIDHEIVLVDDGSTPALEPLVRSWNVPQIRILRQANQGLIGAKNSGLEMSSGTYVHFLDSDDVVHRSKFELQLNAMERDGLDASLGDSATFDLEKPGAHIENITAPNLIGETDEFFLTSQPAPHALVFKREYLSKALHDPVVPPSRAYNPIGEVWMYYNLALHPSRLGYVPGAIAATGMHLGERITNHWEKQGVAALLIMEQFWARCPKTDETFNARRLVGKNAFTTWRGLPRDFQRDIENRFLAVWNKCPSSSFSELGGRFFGHTARLTGASLAARIFKRFQRPGFDAIATMTRAEVESFLHLSESLIATGR